MWFLRGYWLFFLRGHWFSLVRLFVLFLRNTPIPEHFRNCKTTPWTTMTTTMTTTTTTNKHSTICLLHRGAFGVSCLGEKNLLDHLCVVHCFARATQPNNNTPNRTKNGYAKSKKKTNEMKWNERKNNRTKKQLQQCLFNVYNKIHCNMMMAVQSFSKLHTHGHM